MKRNRPPYDLADSLWNVTVSFVLYVALLLVLNRTRAAVVTAAPRGIARGQCS